MDPVTHALTGYVISNVIHNKSYKENATPLGTFSAATVLGAVIPDIDFISNYIGGSTLYFMFHRTITHSPLAIILQSFLCGLIIKIFKRDSNYALLVKGALFGGISHILLDVTNVYSTLALWPFSNKMYSLGIMSIIDFFVLCLYIVSAVLTFIKPLRTHRRKIFSSILAIVVCYIGLKAYIQHDIKNYLLSEYNKGKLTAAAPSKVEKISVMADFIGINSWNFIIENGDEFIKGNLHYNNYSYSNISSIRRNESDIAFQRASQTPLGQFVLKFSPFVDHTTERYKDGYLVQLIDLRYTFGLRIGKDNNSDYKHIFGGYVILDNKYNPVYWSIDRPLK